MTKTARERSPAAGRSHVSQPDGTRLVTTASQDRVVDLIIERINKHEESTGHRPFVVGVSAAVREMLAMPYGTLIVGVPIHQTRPDVSSNGDRTGMLATQRYGIRVDHSKEVLRRIL